MLDNCTDNKERWNAVENLLQNWLRERRDILVRYTAIAATLSKSDDAEKLQSGLRDLCQLLVDYVSVGHFEVFYELIREAEAFADGSGKLANDIIPKIGDTTEVILGFDEKYPLPVGAISDHSADLSLLGEILELRFELEDALIAGMHMAHAAQVSNQGA
jgi:regulator of sigma D